ncbi:ribosome maturation factor RimP [Lactobacillus mulieris]|uniref:Ribosome maturation factor RimP n=1 Tax=Lactobacillus mulieris TaxID=2508708 RepID=A0AAW5WWW7_9LACO|nr:ribosome maturation factor RimP [Lactobacillus mulieris]MCZ3621474.1 ribosome maturation factor RimP [Lactobacillus mulieris]MCZ3623250.1 ribosome maturation factor RimP [Lactobacillus mulieris]MCZ3635481.1 ribosome maturation factor RimP [Lactobacillus mulieris]MCZ3689411.1 ribosome maturation factor RimP [Lactobacillus mulieris]MCZ3695414.1 ribosome maturation factor RimP [Lactobacillus mulieris]
MTKIIDLVTDLVTPLAEKRGDELVDVEYVKEKNQYYLRIYVDRGESGIDIEEIAALSEIVSEELDKLNPDPFTEPYMLELSSPGLERPIKNERDWRKALNKYIHVACYQKIDGQKSFDGTLLSRDNEKITLKIKIKTRTKELEIPIGAIANARFAIEF